MTTKAERFAARRVERAAALARQLDGLLTLAGDERAIDVGAGAGALAFALATRAREVVALEVDEEMAEQARAAAPANVQVVVGDGERLPFADGTFDLGATLRTLHHTAHPDLLLAELCRVVRSGGTLLVVDQLAPAEPQQALELDRFETAREPSHTRLLPEAELRGLFAEHGLVVEREEIVREPRELASYLDLAGCEGEERERARALAPAGYEGVLGWFVLRRL